MRPTFAWLLVTSCALPAQAALSVFGRQHIDVLVSNAAVNPAGGPILQMEDHVIDKILQVIGASLVPCCASLASFNRIATPAKGLTRRGLLQINVRSAIWVTREAAKHMKTVGQSQMLIKTMGFCLSSASPCSSLQQLHEFPFLHMLRYMLQGGSVVYISSFSAFSPSQPLGM
jgi:NAD(P)-dependent dehydrogenase (short-subunit alcohol dehydrogenase family)